MSEVKELPEYFFSNKIQKGLFLTCLFHIVLTENQLKAKNSPFGTLWILNIMQNTQFSWIRKAAENVMNDASYNT